MVLSRDVTAAMLVSLKKGTVAMLVSPTNPPGIDLYHHANDFFILFQWKNKLTDHASENTLLEALLSNQSTEAYSRINT